MEPMPELTAKPNPARDKAIAEAKTRQREAVEGQDKALIEAEPQLEGYDETQPGQTEVVAGSVEHQQVLKAYPNATSYAGDVNVVLPPEEEPPPPDPPSTLSDALSGGTYQSDTKHDTKHDTKSGRDKS